MAEKTTVSRVVIEWLMQLALLFIADGAVTPERLRLYAKVLGAEFGDHIFTDAALQRAAIGEGRGYFPACEVIAQRLREYQLELDPATAPDDGKRNYWLRVMERRRVAIQRGPEELRPQEIRSARIWLVWLENNEPLIYRDLMAGPHSDEWAAVQEWPGADLHQFPTQIARKQLKTGAKA
ncbi:hypothetical protein AA0243_3014 [Novacetimonas hansenii NRIC 0243]|nr:hypothetical protein AA0243_3014 [Novacetimonas hansenii NRIC 0243]